jgi:hypothetical protein
MNQNISDTTGIAVWSARTRRYDANANPKRRLARANSSFELRNPATGRSGSVRHWACRIARPRLFVVLVVQQLRYIDAHEVGAAHEACSRRHLDMAHRQVDNRGLDAVPAPDAVPNEVLDEVLHSQKCKDSFRRLILVSCALLSPYGYCGALGRVSSHAHPGAPTACRLLRL